MNGPFQPWVFWVVFGTLFFSGIALVLLLVIQALLAMTRGIRRWLRSARAARASRAPLSIDAARWKRTVTFLLVGEVIAVIGVLALTHKATAMPAPIDGPITALDATPIATPRRPECPSYTERLQMSAIPQFDGTRVFSTKSALEKYGPPDVSKYVPIGGSRGNMAEVTWVWMYKDGNIRIVFHQMRRDESAESGDNHGIGKAVFAPHG